MFQSSCTFLKSFDSVMWYSKAALIRMFSLYTDRVVSSRLLGTIEEMKFKCKMQWCTVTIACLIKKKIPKIGCFAKCCSNQQNMLRNDYRYNMLKYIIVIFCHIDCHAKTALTVQHSFNTMTPHESWFTATMTTKHCNAKSNLLHSFRMSSFCQFRDFTVCFLL